ncbi:MAG TPA: methyltransferase domain-containing protein [Acidimicrobiales bacterium]|nr:methyltransferase domain-containing protein [Acidimicrobiales bacterium]
MTADAGPFPPGFFERADPSPDRDFYGPTRLVTHIDERAIDAVGSLYAELGIRGRVLDLMASWVSHFRSAPETLVLLGLNPEELSVNRQARGAVVADLNAGAGLPFRSETYDAATCCVSVDYLTDPLHVFSEVRRVLRGGAPFVCTFSNRCFPTKAIRGWLYSTDAEHCAIVARYFELSGGWERPVVQQRTPVGQPGDPLFAVWARKRR